MVNKRIKSLSTSRMCKLSLVILLLSAKFNVHVYSQINTGVVVLNHEEKVRFKEHIKRNTEVASIYDSIKNLADAHVKEKPNPVKVIHFEGMLENDPKRVECIKSLMDVNKVVDLIYTAYGSSESLYGIKVKEIVLAWADTYLPTGNTINENKLTPLFWGYYIHKEHFTKYERKKVDSWISSIAEKEVARKHTPNNNWQAKRLKIVGSAGCILDHDGFKRFAIKGVSNYISSAYYPDGTSNDLKKRDALHYHSSGIEPILDITVNLQKFDSRFDQYSYTDSLGTSIEKAIEFMVPYLSGEKTHREWVNTKVDLDKKRARAGLKEYQPGVLYDPRDAIPMLNWAVYYRPDLYEYICGCRECYFCNIEAFLNSPLIRN